MNPIFNYSQIPSFSFGKIAILSFLTNQQKKIFSIVLLALGYLALCYTLFQKFTFYQKITFKPPQPILSQEEIALKELEKGINLPLVKKLELAKQAGSSLIRLNFWESEVKDAELLEVFKACPKLQYLHIGFCKHITGQFLYQLPQDLKSLQINGCDLTTINLNSLPKGLESFHLSGCKNLTDDILIDFLANPPPNLNELDIGYCSQLTGAFLSKLPNSLRSLILSRFKNLPAEALKHLPQQLRSLRLCGCNLANVYFNHLSDSIEILDIYSCQNLNHFILNDHLKNLKSLSLQFQYLTNAILNQLSPTIEVDLFHCDLQYVDLDQLPPHLFTMNIKGCDLKAELRARKLLAKALSSKVIKNHYEQAKLTPHSLFGTTDEWSIKFLPGLEFLAECDISNREIRLRTDLTDNGAMLYFVFELTNAMSSLKHCQNAQKIQNGEIECEEYVLATERIEFEGTILADKVLKAAVEEMGWDHSLFSYFHNESLAFERYWHQIRFSKHAQYYRDAIKNMGKQVQVLGFKDRLVSVGYLLKHLSFKDLTKILAIGMLSGYLISAFATSIMGMTSTIYSIGIFILAGCIGAIARRCLYPFNLSEDLQIISDFSLGALSSLSACIPALRASALTINALALGNIVAHIWNL